MFRRKRKFEELDDNKDGSSMDCLPNKKQRKNKSSPFTRLPVKRTFARNRRNKTKAKHLHKSVQENISESDSDSDFDPKQKNRKKITYNRNRKYSPLKLNKKFQSTLDFPVIKACSNLNKKKFNKCGPSKCSDCGMLYYIGREEDDSLHSKFHKKFMDKFENGYKPLLLSRFCVWNFQQIAKNAPYFVRNDKKNKNKNYKQMKLQTNGRVTSGRGYVDVKNRNDLILCINYEEFIELKKKNGDILSCVDMMDRDLGYFTTKQLENNQYSNGFNDSMNNKDIVHSLDKNQSLYCFVERTGHKIVACIVCEALEFAYKIKIKPNDNVITSNVERSDLKEKCYVGIIKIWVHHKYRRKCIASLLLDCVRRHFIYGTHIHKEYIAFCQPTRMGQEFARKYCETNHILVY